MFTNEELKTIYKSLDDYVSDYEEMDNSKILPILSKIEDILNPVSYTHLRAHETVSHLV